MANGGAGGAWGAGRRLKTEEKHDSRVFQKVPRRTENEKMGGMETQPTERHRQEEGLGE